MSDSMSLLKTFEALGGNLGAVCQSLEAVKAELLERVLEAFPENGRPSADSCELAVEKVSATESMVMLDIDSTDSWSSYEKEIQAALPKLRASGIDLVRVLTVELHSTKEG